MIIESIDSITIENPKNVNVEQKSYFRDFKNSKGDLLRREYKVSHLIVKGKLEDGRLFEYKITSPYTVQMKIDGEVYMKCQVGKTPEVEYERIDL